MRKSVIVILVALCCLSVKANIGKSLVIRNANVIDVASGKIRLLNIKIKKGKISKASSKKIRGSNWIDLKGKFVLPHLWDMHVHFHGDADKLEEHAKAGILGVRDMGAFGKAEFDFLKKLTSKANQNETSPTTYFAGFTHNGRACEVPQHNSIDTAQELRNAVDFQTKNSLLFFKIHNCFPASLFPELLRLAKKENLKIVGHIPQGIDPIEYAKMGVSSIEHIDIIVRALSFRKNRPAKSITEAIEVLEGEYLDKLADALIENDVALTTTLVTYENYVNNLPEKQKPLGNAVFKRLKKFTKRLSDKGVLLLAGTDLGLLGIEPGTSLIRELELMVESGISPRYALKTATFNPAKYLGVSGLSINKGSKASFIVVEKNPLANIGNLKTIHAIVKNGEYRVL